MSTAVSSPKSGSHPVIRSAVVLGETLRLPTMLNMLSRDAVNLMTTKPDTRKESDKHAPIMVVNDLTKGSGMEVEVRIHHDVDGEPIMGTENAEGKGSERTGDSDTLKIDKTTKAVKDGDLWSGQERGYKLKDFNKADLGVYFRKLQDQRITFALGGRGHYAASDIFVPLEGAANHDKIMVNPIKAPSNYNGGDGSQSRHFFAASRDGISGTADPLTTADTLTFKDIRLMKVRVEEMAHPPEPVSLSMEDDVYGYEPMYVLTVTPRGWQDLTEDAGTKEFEVMRGNAIARMNIQANGKKGVHPVFRGDCILIDNILVRKMPYPIRFLPGVAVTMDDFTKKEYSAVTQTIAGGANYAVERALLIGGQALAVAFGNAMYGAKKAKNTQARNFNFLENPYDFGRKSETAIEWVDGVKKMSFDDAEGVHTDRGVIALDYATRLT